MPLNKIDNDIHAPLKTPSPPGNKPGMSDSNRYLSFLGRICSLVTLKNSDLIGKFTTIVVKKLGTALGNVSL